MKRLALAFLLLAACSGKSKPATTAGAGSGSGSGSAALYAKKFVVSFGITQQASSADVFLQTTTETGAQVSYAAGTYPGECKVIKPADEMKALTGVSCAFGDTSVELDAVVSGTEVVVLKASAPPGATPDPMSREEVLRVKVPAGAAAEGP